MNRGQFFLKSLFCRGWILYAVMALAGVFFVDIKSLASHAKPATLSRLRPNYSAIGSFAKGTGSWGRKEMEDYRLYLENVNSVMGQRPDTDALLGYVLFYLGENRRAEEVFGRAVRSNPVFFWNYYNLGVLAYQRGELARARELLQDAVKQDPHLSLRFIISSRIFIPLMSDSMYSPQLFWENLCAGYSDAYKILVMIEFSGRHFERVLSSAQSGLKISMRDSDRVFFLYFIGASALESGSLPAAAKVFEECLKLDAEYPEALSGMASILQHMGRSDSATELLSRVKSIQSKRGSGLPGPRDFKVKVF